MHRASYRVMPPSGITETLSDVESVRVVHDGWMKNPKSAMISCNDGFRPVSFLLETMEEDAE